MLIDLKNNYIHDNQVIVTAGEYATNISHVGTGDFTPYTGSPSTKSNLYDRNAYAVPATTSTSWLWGTAKTFTAWVALPQDAGGAVAVGTTPPPLPVPSPTPAPAPSPTPTPVPAPAPSPPPVPVSLPGKATNPSPRNGGSAPVHVTLKWTAATGATSYDVYFGTDGSSNGANLPLVSINQSALSYNPGTLTRLTTYYWRVISKNVTGNTTGDLWKFTTKKN